MGQGTSLVTMKDLVATAATTGVEPPSRQATRGNVTQTQLIHWFIEQMREELTPSKFEKFLGELYGFVA